MRILLAEDDLLFREMLKSLLRSAGHEVLEARNGLDAWEQFKKSPVSLVISDRVMPGLDGLGLCRKIRGVALDKYCYFILLTARREHESSVEAFEAGVDDFLTKPLNEEDLAVRLHVAQRILGAFEQITQLKSLLPACCYCNKVREDDNKRWVELEDYIRNHTRTDFSHGICPSCMKKHFPEVAAEEETAG